MTVVKPLNNVSHCLVDWVGRSVRVGPVGPSPRRVGRVGSGRLVGSVGQSGRSDRVGQIGRLGCSVGRSVPSVRLSVRSSGAVGWSCFTRGPGRSADCGGRPSCRHLRRATCRVSWQQAFPSSISWAGRRGCPAPALARAAIPG